MALDLLYSRLLHEPIPWAPRARKLSTLPFQGMPVLYLIVLLLLCHRLTGISVEYQALIFDLPDEVDDIGIGGVGLYL
jgi:hypothetical protein